MNEIAIVEDETDLLEAYVENLKLAGIDAIGFVTAEDFLWKFDEIKPQLVIIDRVLPGINGLETVKTLRQKAPYTKIIMLSGQDSPQQIEEGFEAGVDEYIKKSTSFDELTVRIKKYLKDLTGDKDITVGKNNFNKKFRKLYDDKHEVFLTGRESEVFSILIAASGEVVSRDDLLNQIGGDANISEKNLNVHMHSLRKKIQDFSLEIETLRGSGYRLKVL